jgi:hypothetical protein
MRAIEPLTSLLILVRRHRHILGIGALVVLTLLVSVERRLAEIQSNFRSTARGFENDDSLGADEIRVRLITLNDGCPPSLPVAAARVVCSVIQCALQRPRFDPVTWPEPRAPPDRPLSVVA